MTPTIVLFLGFAALAKSSAIPAVKTEVIKTGSHYDFAYDVAEPHFGDFKSHKESRRGDVVKGSYSVLDPDNTIRTVDYIADSNGFNATVHQEPVSPEFSPVVLELYDDHDDSHDEDEEDTHDEDEDESDKDESDEKDEEESGGLIQITLPLQPLYPDVARPPY